MCHVYQLNYVEPPLNPWLVEYGCLMYLRFVGVCLLVICSCFGGANFVFGDKH